MNVESVPHFYDRLPSESPLRARYAQPALTEAQYLWPALIALLGVAVIASGTVLAGLAALVVGGVWSARMRSSAEDSAAARALWAQEKVCLAGEHRFVP